MNVPMSVADGIPQALSTLSSLLAYAVSMPGERLPPIKPASEFVKELRETYLKMTQEEFADELGVNRTMVAKWETDVDQPSWPNVWKMLCLTGVVGTRLRPGQTPGVESLNMNATERGLLAQFRRLPQETQIEWLIKIAGEVAKSEVTASQLPAAQKKG